MRVAAIAAAILLLLPGALRGQARSDSVRKSPGDTLAVFVPPVLLGLPVPSAGICVVPQGDTLKTFAPNCGGLLIASRLLPPAGAVRMPRPPSPDSAKSLGPFGEDLGLHLQTRLETKGERMRNERCSASQVLDPFANCRGKLQPDFGLQFQLKSAGTIGERTHVDVDYDTQREFDASNTLSLYYQGKSGEHLERLEVGNVTFTPPPSRYITASIPSGNYGAQAVARFGPMRFRAIAAQQKGNVVLSRQFTVGDRTLQGNEREIEDYQIEQRRFFFVVDPALFTGEYPNIDILDRNQLDRIRRILPDTLRPTRVVVYRIQFGTQPLDANGPRFYLNDGAKSGVPTVGRQTYDVLREGVDYYIDRSNLWLALVRPLNATNERLVVAYYVRLGASTRDTIWKTTGGTPDLNVRPPADSQLASLVWDPRIATGSAAFRREIRSVYRIAGSDLVRASAKVRVVAGAGDQEQPAGGGAATYLQMFGLAQRNNSGEFDTDNRLWPRPGDGIYNATAGAGVAGGVMPPLGASPLPGTAGVGAAIISDYYLVLPSLRPFAAKDSGLVALGNAPNDAIYSTPGDYLDSPQHPPSVYRLRVRYDAEGGRAAGALELGSVQIRRGSDRVLLDGKPLTRDVDYRMDYETGRITFLRPDTLFLQPRAVDVRFEQNPIFAPTPTTLFGLTSELAFPHGQLNFTAISQSQRTSFTRPQLGFEPTSALLAGVSGQFAWNLPLVSRMLSKLSLPFGNAPSPNAPASFAIQGEVAASRPMANANAQAYIESFESDAGIPVDLSDIRWYFGSVPPAGHGALPGGFAPDTTNAAQLAWQTNALYANGAVASFPITAIDPEVALASTGFTTAEPLLWLTLYPDTIGRLKQGTDRPDWIVPRPVAGSPPRRWRSIRTSLSTTGLDLTRSDFLEFWAFIDTTAAFRRHNPVLVFDLGDISEASLAYRPETLYVASTGADSMYRRRRTERLDSLDSERDPFSHAFSVGVNDVGLPGDLLDTLVVVDSAHGAFPQRATRFTMCRGYFSTILRIGDPRADCTAGNNRLDEEDLDLDNALNLTYGQREQENIRRYVVDLSDPARYARIGGEVQWDDPLGGRTRQWVLVRVPLAAPNDSLGMVDQRRVRTLRLSVVSAPGTGDEFDYLALARLGFGGTPWVKRADGALAGVGGDHGDAGAVLASLIGTNDYDPTRGVLYQAPPGYRNQLQSKAGVNQSGVFEINERSLRVQATHLALYDRAEAYTRFPGGEQNFMSYGELRLWARGRGHGWGPQGELQMYVKMGRDENNFYLYRAPVNEGPDSSAWNPEIRVDFQRFFDLRGRVEQAYLSHGATAHDSLSCTGLDSALVAASALPLAGSGPAHRFAACDGTGYIVYTLDPAITPPNLAAVQELSVGILRVADAPLTASSTATAPGDTLELWVDEIRLARPVGNPGYAGQVGATLTLGDLGDIRVNFTRKNPHFRQLSEQPSFLDEQAIEVAGTLRLDKFLPFTNGFALPLTISRISSTADPLFLSQSDIAGRGIPGLRRPRNDVTTLSLTVRRTKPIANPLLGPLLNNLAATSSYVGGGSRNEYQSGSTHHFALSLDYAVADSAKVIPAAAIVRRSLRLLPAYLQAGIAAALGDGAIRWNPTQLRLTSGVTQGSDRRLSFSAPVQGEGADPRLSLALTNLWRNGSVVELRPVSSLTARWEALSVRDLRQYGDSNAYALVAGAERGSIFGRDAGFERERNLQSSVLFAPQLTAWLRPHAEFGTQYSMLRDPNAQLLIPKPGVIGVDSLLAHLDSARLLHPDSVVSRLTLPRRVLASQTTSAGLTLDLAAALRDSTRRSLGRRLGGAFAPIDVTITRNILAAFDAAPFALPAALQFGFGSPDAFRSVRGMPASTAGSTTSLVATNTVTLPLGTALAGRYRRTLTNNWVQGLDSTQSRIDGTQTVFPDVSLRWLLRPVLMQRLISSLTASVGYTVSAASSSIPIVTDPTVPAGEQREVRTTNMQSYPLTTSIAWGFANLSTAAGYTFSHRVDSLSGSLTRANTGDLNVDVGRTFRLPASLGFGYRNDIRAHLGYQRSQSQITVFDPTGNISSRLGDQGRSALNLNADTDLSSSLLFTFQVSRVVSYDNLLNRRTNQFVLSTVLQMQFFGGKGTP